jgi:uncharacterized membrane protein
MKYNIAPYRITSIDILRGMIMIIMALDHTRDFFHITAMTADPMAGAAPEPALYFTRWITHFCAPLFVFLSGISAYLSSKKKTPAEASLFLIKRGIWLIVAELVLITLALTFNPLYNIIILQVIWVIGCSMIILALLSRLSFRVVLITGLLLFFGHNILDKITLPPSSFITILFTARGSAIPLSSTYFILDLYAVLPWTGIMLLGYCSGYFYAQGMFTPQRRQRIFLLTGTALILLFIVLRFTNSYGEPSPFTKGLFSFLNTSKYPPSLLYSCMTLGPAFIFLAVLENAKGRWSDIISTYGKVPFFYYVLHFYLLHSLLVIAFFASGYNSSQIVDPNIPFLFRPASFGYSLPVVYAIWLVVIVVLYFPCRWFIKYKQQHQYWWLKYV